MSAPPVAPESQGRRARSDRRLIAARLRRASWCVVAGLGLVVASGGVVVHGDRSALDVEVRVQDAIDARVGDPDLWNHVFGTVIPRAGLVILVALATWTLTQRWWRGLAACAAAPLAVAITEHALKPLIDRKDPGPANPEFFYPSGHLTGVGAITLLALVLVLPGVARTKARVALVALCIVAVGVALFATIAGRGHGPLDAAAGLPTGAAIALAWVLLIDAACDALSPSKAAQTTP